MPVISNTRANATMYCVLNAAMILFCATYTFDWTCSYIVSNTEHKQDDTRVDCNDDLFHLA